MQNGYQDAPPGLIIFFVLFFNILLGLLAVDTWHKKPRTFMQYLSLFFIVVTFLFSAAYIGSLLLPAVGFEKIVTILVYILSPICWLSIGLGIFIYGFYFGIIKKDIYLGSASSRANFYRLPERLTGSDAVIAGILFSGLSLVLLYYWFLFMGLLLCDNFQICLSPHLFPK